MGYEQESAQNMNKNAMVSGYEQPPNYANQQMTNNMQPPNYANQQMMNNMQPPNYANQQMTNNMQPPNAANPYNVPPSYNGNQQLYIVPPPPNVIVVNQQSSTNDPGFCSTCNKQTSVRIEYKNGTLVWLLCVGLFFIGCNLGCCLIPFCIDDLKDKEYYCSSCNSYRGEKKSM